jgi:acyl-CoA thioesterase I
MSMKSLSAIRFAALVLATLMIGCGDAERNGAPQAGAPGMARSDTGAATDDAVGRQPPSMPPGAPGTAGESIVLFVGTSLTAGYGLPEEQSFPARIQQRIDAAGLPFRTINAGVSGETSSGALRRIDWLLQQPFDLFVLETGGNDMLRGTDPDVTEKNIQTIVDRVRTARPDALIVLAGMLAMPNLGREYTRRFEEIYPRIAERNGLPLIPFLLEGVAAERELNLPDGIHPNAEGQRIVADNVWAVIEPMLRARAERLEEAIDPEAAATGR